MHLRFLAISDTHLGEDTSLLCFPQGRRRLREALVALFGGGDSSVRVDELILVGDIPDRTLSSTSQITTQTHAFMATLTEVLDVGRVVYLPGNHDHTLWSAYVRARRGQGSGITAPEGEPLVRGGEVVPGAEAGASALVSLLFGHALRAGGGTPDLVVANPLYAQTFHDRVYLFTHGTHFRREVVAPTWLKAALDASQVPRLVAHLDLEAGGDVAGAVDLADLERRVSPFVDSLWPSSGKNPTSTSDELWFLLSHLSGKLDRRREAPLEDALLDQDALASLGRDGHDPRVARLTPEHPSASPPFAAVARYANAPIERCRRYFLRHALAHARATGPVTFVFGDTREGGFGRLPGPDGGELRVYNTGAWVVTSAGHHPPCHLFAVDDAGREYLADVTFRGVLIDERPLLEVAAEDVEHRKRGTGRLLRALVSLLPTAASPPRGTR